MVNAYGIRIDMRFVLLMGVVLVSFVQCAHAQQGVVGAGGRGRWSIALSPRLLEAVSLLEKLQTGGNHKPLFTKRTFRLRRENEEERQQENKDLRRGAKGIVLSGNLAVSKCISLSNLLLCSDLVIGVRLSDGKMVIVNPKFRSYRTRSYSISVLPEYKLENSAIAAEAQQLKARNAAQRLCAEHQKKLNKNRVPFDKGKNYARRVNPIQQITGGR